MFSQNSPRHDVSFGQSRTSFYLISVHVPLQPETWARSVSKRTDSMLSCQLQNCFASCFWWDSSTANLTGGFRSYRATRGQTMNPTFLIALVLVTGCICHAQDRVEPCIKNRNTPPISSYYWPPDADVRVYFSSKMFTLEQRMRLFAAMNSWTNVASESGSGIKFIYAGEVNRIMSCTRCLTVTTRQVHKTDRKHYAFFNPVKQDNKRLLISAGIDFDFATTNPQALQDFMAHELGHGMGP